MRHRRHRVSTVVLIIVLVAIPPAGVLQYHLLDQAMDAEAASLMRVANATTRQIRGDLAYEAMSLVSVLASWDASEDDTARLIELYEAWASGARFPELVESIVIATGEGGQTTYRAHRPDSDSFRVVDPADLPWLAQLAAGPDLRVPGDPRVTADPFVLGVPVFRFVRTDDRTAVEAPAAQPSRMYVRIDRSVLVTGVIPRLVADHVGDGPDAFHVALVDTASSAVLFSTTDVTFADLSLDRTPRAGAIAPDEVAPLLRPGSASSILARLRSSGGANPVAQQWVALLEWARIDDPSRPHEAARPEGDIALAVWHPAGGVRRAAQIDRNRNLALSYAFLGGVAAMAVMFHVLYLRTVRRRVREQEFVASVTHELRTPVAAMHAAAENLAEGVVTRPERVREYGRSLLDESRRLRTLVDQTLRLSGLQTDLAMRFEPVDVRAVVLEELAAESRLAPGDVHLRIDDAAGPVLTDEGALRSIAANLISNAARHNPDGTRIDVDVSVERGPSRSWLVVRVSDKGVGIARRELRRVREAFYRGRRSRRAQVPGMGLGLSIVERIVTRAGGKLHIDSVAGRGTRVTATLPYRTTRAERDEAGASNTDR